MNAYPCPICGDPVALQGDTCSQECWERQLGFDPTQCTCDDGDECSLHGTGLQQTNWDEMVCKCCGETGHWEHCNWCDVNCSYTHVPRDRPERWDGQVNIHPCNCEGSTSSHWVVGNYINAIETDCELHFFGPKQWIQKTWTDVDIPF